MLPFGVLGHIDLHWLAAAAGGCGVSALFSALRRFGRAPKPMWLLLARPAWRVGAWIIGIHDIDERDREFRERVFDLWQRYLLDKAEEAVTRRSARRVERRRR